MDSLQSVYALPPVESLPLVRQETRRFLISRIADFWLIGGASGIAWFVMLATQLFGDRWSVHHHVESLAVVTASLALLINYPHFMLSYKIAYGRGWQFVKQAWFALLLVPAFLTAFLAVAYLSYSEPNFIPARWNPLSLHRGEGLMTLLIGFMYFTVGWHYVKQAFGCALVYARFDAYPIDPKQRRILLFLLRSVWAVNLLYAQTGVPKLQSLYGIPTFTLGLSPLFLLIADVSFWGLLGAFIYQVVYRNWRQFNKLPSLNFLVPICALVLWWIPIFIQPLFYFYLAPLFHSLQYLPFALRYENGRHLAKHRGAWTGSLQIILIILCGFLSFEFFPDLADSYLRPADMLHAAFFMAAAHIFINIHHYFIDNAIWKMQQPEVKAYLLGKTY